MRLLEHLSAGDLRDVTACERACRTLAALGRAPGVWRGPLARDFGLELVRAVGARLWLAGWGNNRAGQRRRVHAACMQRFMACCWAPHCSCCDQNTQHPRTAPASRRWTCRPSTPASQPRARPLRCASWRPTPTAAPTAAMRSENVASRLLVRASPPCTRRADWLRLVATSSVPLLLLSPPFPLPLPPPLRHSGHRPPACRLHYWADHCFTPNHWAPHCSDAPLDISIVGLLKVRQGWGRLRSAVWTGPCGAVSRQRCTSMDARRRATLRHAPCSWSCHLNRAHHTRLTCPAARTATTSSSVPSTPRPSCSRLLAGAPRCSPTLNPLRACCAPGAWRGSSACLQTCSRCTPWRGGGRGHASARACEWLGRQVALVAGASARPRGVPLARLASR